MIFWDSEETCHIQPFIEFPRVSCLVPWHLVNIVLVFGLQWLQLFICWSDPTDVSMQSFRTSCRSMGQMSYRNWSVVHSCSPYIPDGFLASFKVILRFDGRVKHQSIYAHLPVSVFSKCILCRFTGRLIFFLAFFIWFGHSWIRFGFSLPCHLAIFLSFIHLGI